VLRRVTSAAKPLTAAGIGTHAAPSMGAGTARPLKAYVLSTQSTTPVTAPAMAL
jgi:hypothetical protein